MKAHHRRVLEAFPDAQLSGKGHEAHCPCHSDRSPSLTISAGTKNVDAVVLKCGAGCDTRDVLAAVGLSMADLYSDKTRRGVKVLRRFDYTDEDGTINYQMRRLGRSRNRWRMVHPDGKGGWANGRGDGPKRLYRLAQLAAQPDILYVFVTEGERDADSLANACQVLTTTVASGSWTDVDLTQLSGRYVTIVIDNDKTGWIKGREAKAACEKAGAMVDVWRPHDQFKDATEAIRAGKDCDTGFEYGVDLSGDGWVHDKWPGEAPRPAWTATDDDGRPHYAITPTALLLDKRLEPHDTNVFLLLDEKAGNTGRAKCTQNQLADVLGVQRQTVSNAIKRLIETGWLIKEKRCWYRVTNPARTHSKKDTAKTPFPPTITPIPQ